MSPEGLRDISGEQWLFGAFSAADSSYSAIQETVNVQRGSESGNNQFNSFLQGGVVDGREGEFQRAEIYAVTFRPLRENKISTENRPIIFF